MKKPSTVNYKKIYTDILRKKFPEKEACCRNLLDKESLSVLDIIELNVRIFGKPDHPTQLSNQKLRSYNTSDILQILDYQKKGGLNNTTTAHHFKLSRNTITKWKKLFC